MTDIPKIDGQSADIVAGNVEALRALFPEAFTEAKGSDGTIQDKIDFEVLRQLLGDRVVTEGAGKYGLSWHGKDRARQLALTPSAATLRPAPEESVDWDTTQNIMIEGDNLEVLKLLQKSYAGRVKLIYIDPPYNTGKDFVYPDDFRDTIGNYLTLTGQSGDGGGKLTSNPETSGRFHTDWLNMMYPRLKLARDLLRDDGVIAISIDDTELHNLTTLVDEIFGADNRKVVAVKMSEASGVKMAPMRKYGIIPKLKESIVIAKKDGPSGFGVEMVPKSGWDREYNLLLDGITKELKNEIDALNVETDIEIGAVERLNQQLVDVQIVSLAERLKQLGIRDDEKTDWCFANAYRICQCATSSTVLELAKANSETRNQTLSAVVNKANDRVYLVRGGWDETSSKPRIQMIFAQDNLAVHPGDFWADIKTTGLDGEGEVPFKNGKKPLRLLKRLLQVASIKNDIVLDFFAGSGSFAEATLRYNKESSFSSRFVLVQLPEPIGEADKEQKIAANFCDTLNKPRTIAELTKERLRRAGAKIKSENPLFTGDTGFRVFKLDRSNIRAWDPDTKDLAASLLDSVNHLIPGRTEQDVLYEVLLKQGLDLCVPMQEQAYNGHKVWCIGGGVLFVCLSDNIDRAAAEAIADGMAAWHKALAPATDTRLIFKDSGFKDDVAKTNLTAILAQHGLKDVRSI
jgi:adenine-specific DNA-methyltransferase